MDDQQCVGDDRERQLARLRWRSRRGMLELELALAPFVAERLDALPSAERARYERLLEHDDWHIYDWIQGRSAPDDPDLAALVGRIRGAAGLDRQ